jgi:hypothetical protein
MATPDDIPSDLTLEISERLTSERFLAAIRAFFAYVDEIGRSTAPKGEAPEWLVSVREGSALIGIDPGPGSNFVTVRQVYARIETGIQRIAAGQYDSADVPDAAIRQLKILSEIGIKRHGSYIPLKLWVNRKPNVIGSDISETIRQDWRTEYTDYGTIEGRLETIQDLGGLQLRIRDAMLGQLVQCRVPEHLLDAVFQSFRKRVEVSGLIHYRKSGIPVDITVDEIISLPDDDSLPTIEEVRGILRNIA